MRLPPAKVRFVGNEERYALGCGDAPDGIDWLYCHDCPAKENCGRDIASRPREFTSGETCEGFFLDYWEGERDNLNVETNLGYVEDFIPLKDFEVLARELAP